VKNKVSLSVFFPAYNDAHSLPTLIEKTFAVATREADVFEIIVINDGSYDNTSTVLRELIDRFGPLLRVVEHSKNMGYGAALRSGFDAARYDLVFYTDGDSQYDVDELPLLLREMKDGVGLVNGYKLKRNDPWHRICIGHLYNTFARTIFGIRLRDIDCDFRLIRREILKGLQLQSNTGTICVELVRGIEASGCGIREVPVHHFARLYGRSEFFRIGSLLMTLRQMTDLYWKVVVAPAVKRSYSIAAIWAR
jgi:glycosyltransferase involved in cell wall biosynthesis